jgi:hypothetical protein
MEIGRKNPRPSAEEIKARDEDYRSRPDYNYRCPLQSVNEHRRVVEEMTDEVSAKLQAAHKNGTYEYEGYPDSIFTYVEEKFEELYSILPTAKMYANRIETPEIYVIGWVEWCRIQHDWIQVFEHHTNFGPMSKHLDELDDRKDVRTGSVWSALINESQDSPCHPFLETFAKVGL